MARLLQALRDHARAVRSFALIWVALWATTIVTWMYDTAGYSFGMPMAVFFVHLIGLPALVGIMIARWNLQGAAAGFIIADGNLLLIAAWGGVLEFGAFVILMGVVGFAAGWIGRIVGNALAAHS